MNSSTTFSIHSFPVFSKKTLLAAFFVGGFILRSVVLALREKPVMDFWAVLDPLTGLLFAIMYLWYSSLPIFGNQIDVVASGVRYVPGGVRFHGWYLLLITSHILVAVTGILFGSMWALLAIPVVAVLAIVGRWMLALGLYLCGRFFLGKM